MSTLGLLCLVLAFSLVLALSVGAASIPPFLTAKFLWKGLIGERNLSPYQTIIFEVRLPRVLLAALVGAALATSGAIFQGLFRNPMADPYIIGVSSGAALGAASAIVFRLNYWILGSSMIPLAAFLGALVATLVVYQVARMGGRIPISALLLSGIALGSFLSAIMSFLLVIKGKDLQAVFFWLMGGFSARGWDHVKMVLPFILLGLPLSFFFARDLNLMLLGEEKAMQLGTDVERLKKTMLVIASLIAAAAVSVSGIIGFVGLMTPHIVRTVLGPDHRILLPTTAVGGAIFLVLADTAARTMLAPSEIPVGIITAFLGAPFFIYLLRLKRRALM
jgi:iron complex transport system permease protein